MKNTVISAIEQHKVIAILRGIPKEKLILLAEALYAGGVRLLEITYSLDKGSSDEAVAENIRSLVEHFKGRMLIGAGTVLTRRQVQLTKEAGGLYIISPSTDVEVIAESNRLGLVSIPGALTPTEIMIAHNAGADFVKLFPVVTMGTEYVKAVKAPLSHVKMLAVGGVDENNMADYLKAGVCGFGIGSNIADKKKVAADDWTGITEDAKKFTEVIKNV